MKKRIKEIAMWIICLLPVIFLVIAYPIIPAQIPMQWGIDGTVNWYGPKINLIWIAVLPALVNGLLILLPKIDPKRDNYEDFKVPYFYMRLGIITFLFLVNVMMLNGVSTMEFNVKILLLMVSALFFYLGLIMPYIKQNYFVGFRLPWTLHDVDTWNQTHKVGAIVLQVTSVIMAVTIILTNNTKCLFIAYSSLLFMAIFGIVIYSAWYYYNKPVKKKK